MLQSRKPAAVAAPMPSVVPMLVRLAIAVLATVTLLFVFTPSVVHAQEAATTHRVEPGESLWSLAVKYYGDGQKWAELAKLNDLGANGEKGLVVGQVIKTPKPPATPAKPSAANPPPNTSRLALARARQSLKTSAGEQSAAGGLAAQTADKSDAAPKGAAKSSQATAPKAVAANKGVTGTPASAAKGSATASPAGAFTSGAIASRNEANDGAVASVSTNIWNIDLPAQRAARGNDQPTVFLRRTFSSVETDSAVKAAIKFERPRVRTGEYVSAPYLVDAQQASKAGVVGRRMGTAAGVRDIERLVLTDETEITVPPGFAPTPGAQLVSIQTAPVTKGGTLVATPTGVLQIVRADAGRPVVARVVRQSGRIEEGQALLPFDGGAVTNAMTVTPVARGAFAPETHVVWVEGDALLPTLQSFLVLAAGEREGIKPGDEFALVKRTGVGADAAELQYATVRVVRVTPLGSTAMVVRQSDALIAVGGSARLIARAN